MKIAAATSFPEEIIRRRSYAIWESEGRLEGHAEEYWLRALAQLQAELERSWRAALEPEAKTDVVMPHPAISQRPTRRESDRLDPATHRKAA